MEGFACRVHVANASRVKSRDVEFMTNLRTIPEATERKLERLGAGR